MWMEWVTAQGGDRMKNVDLNILNCRRQWTTHVKCSVGIWNLKVGKGRAHTQNWDWSAQRWELNIWEQVPFQRVSLVAQMIKNLPAMQETWVWSLGGEGPLEESMASHTSILAWRIPWTEEPGGLQSIGSQRVGHIWATNTFICTSPFRTDHWTWPRKDQHWVLQSIYLREQGEDGVELEENRQAG